MDLADVGIFDHDIGKLGSTYDVLPFRQFVFRNSLAITAYSNLRYPPCGTQFGHALHDLQRAPVDRTRPATRQFMQFFTNVDRKDPFTSLAARGYQTCTQIDHRLLRGHRVQGISSRMTPCKTTHAVLAQQ